MSIEFSFESGPQISVRAEVERGSISAALLAPSDQFRLVLSEDGEIADKIYHWCLAYSRKNGQLPELPMTKTALSSFEEKVLEELKRIPLGKTLSYKQLAECCGSPKAFRAAGRACGKNPLPLFIPCHRILASDGALGGFSQGLEVKRRLLAFEV